MTVPELGQKIKTFTDGVGRGDIYIALIVVLVGASSFGLGRLSKIETTRSSIPILIEEPDPSVLGEENIPLGGGAGVGEENIVEETSEGLLVGSKNSDRYHYPWCSGAQRIKEENKVWFKSIEEARAAGYLPAGNCKGLE